MEETSKQLQFLIRPYSKSKWQNIIMQDFPDFNLSIQDKLFQFDFSSYEPEDSLGNAIIPMSGDDIVICTDRTYTKVFGDIFAGSIEKKSHSYHGLTDDNSRYKTLYSMTVRQRNFGIESIQFETLEVRLINNILEELFYKSRSELGGVLKTGQVIPKFKLVAANIEVSPFSLAGDPMDILQEILKSIGYNYQIEYYPEPDDVNTLNLFQSYVIFDKAGFKAISPDWNLGITLNTVHKGLIINPEYEIKQNYKYILTESDLEYTEDATVMKTWLNFIAKVKNLVNLSRYSEISQDGVKDTFSFPAAYDVAKVAITTRSTILNKISDTQFTIEDLPSQSLIRYQERLINNDLGKKLELLIQPSFNNTDIPESGIFRKIEIDGTKTITLLEATPAFKAGDSIELVDSFDIVSENYDDPGNYDVLPADANGYVIKHLSDNEDLSSIKFTDVDKPNIVQEVIVYYYAVKKNPQQQAFPDKIKQYGLKILKEEFPYTLTTEQLELINNEYFKFTKPLETIVVKSYRPTLARIGWSLPVNIPEVTGNFIVSDVSAKVIGYKDSVYKNDPIFEQTITLASYLTNLDSMLAFFKNSDNVAKSKLKEIRKEMFSDTLTFVWTLNDGSVPYTLLPPTATAPTAISNTSFTANWSFVDGATSYIIELFLDLACTNAVLGYTGGIFLGNVTSYIFNNSYISSEAGPFYFRVRAKNGDTLSGWSNLMTVNKVAEFRDLPINSNTLIYSHHRNSEIENVADIIGTTDGIFVNLDTGQTPYTTGIIEGDDTCVILGGTNQYIEYPLIAFNSSTFTASIALRFITIKSYSIILGNYNAPNTQFEFEYNYSTKKFRILLYSGTQPDAVLGLVNDIDITLAIDTNYLFEISWNQTTNTFKFYMNGVNYACTKNEGSETLASLVVRNDITNRLRVGAYNHYGSINSNVTGFFINAKILRTKYTKESIANDAEAMNNYNILFGT